MFNYLSIDSYIESYRRYMKEMYRGTTPKDYGIMIQRKKKKKKKRK